MNTVSKRSIFRFLAPAFLAVIFCLFSAKPATADVIYNFSLGANGGVSAFSVNLRFASLLPADGLLVFNLASSPAVDSFSFTTPGFSAANSVVGLQITPTATLVGLSLRDAANAPLLFTVAFPADFFSFTRAPGDLGGFTSTAGKVTSILPLNTATPTANLSVREVTPEPVTAVLLLTGLVIGGWYARKRSS